MVYYELDMKVTSEFLVFFLFGSMFLVVTNVTILDVFGPCVFCFERFNRTAIFSFFFAFLTRAFVGTATFMLDTGEELWLWQGWWPETAADDNDKDDEDEDETSRAADGEQPVVADHRGSLSTRLQAERRAAMQTALDYWNRKYGDDVDPKAYLVWAGLEPLRFTDCFPEWHDRDDIAEINMKVRLVCVYDFFCLWVWY